MATIINNPGNSGSTEDGSGLVFGVLIAIVLVGAFIIWGLPALRNTSTTAANPNDNTTNINVEVPAPIVTPSDN